MSVKAAAISDKTHRAVVRDLLKGGTWTLEALGSGHFQLQAVGSKGELHVVTVAGTPRTPSPDRIRSQVRRCMDGKCGHGGAVAKPQANDGMDRAERRAVAALERALAMPAVDPMRPRETVVAVKPKRKASRPGYEKALKWVRWWSTSPAATAHMSSGPIPQKRIADAAKEAGHSWTQVREALEAIGAKCDYRGRNGSYWTFPATTEAGTGSSEPAEPDPVEVAVDRAAGLDVEWARLEGMAAMVSPTLVEQVAKVRGMVDA